MTSLSNWFRYINELADDSKLDRTKEHRVTFVLSLVVLAALCLLTAITVYSLTTDRHHSAIEYVTAIGNGITTVVFAIVCSRYRSQSS